MDDILINIRSILRDAVACLYFAGLYLSMKKCFLKNSKGRPAYLVTFFITNPYVIVYITAWVYLILYAVALSLKGHDAIYIRDHMLKMSYSDSVLFSLAVGIISTLVVLLISRLVGKIMKANNPSLVTYIYLMFSILVVLADGRSSFEYGFEVLDSSISILNSIAIIAAILLIYFFIVKELAKMADDHMSINWKIFVIPPVIFLLVYYMLDFLLFRYTGDEAKMVAKGFSIIVLFLFIWAFYIITKNINATNEAITAKNEIKTLSVEVMEALANTIDAKDKYTNGHSIRVAKYSRMIAEKMGLPVETCENIYYMGLLHDIGKIGVPNEIINKPSRLDDREYDIIKTHPRIGYEILSKIQSRPELMKGARWHHERIDGKGYPDMISGEDIPLESRIIAVADAYDAMTSNRSYRQYLSQDKVRSEIEKCSGTQFDPEIAKYMLMIIEEDREYILHE